MEKKKIPVALMIAAGMLLYNNTVAAQSLPPTQETSQHQLRRMLVCMKQSYDEYGFFLFVYIIYNFIRIYE